MSERIVVGVDGSAGARAALDWAFREAALRGAGVHAVAAWSYPYVGDIAGMAAAVRTELDFEGAARATAEHEVESARTELGDAVAGVPVRIDVEDGPAASVLLAAAKGADLLVVGSRGRGGFTGLLLGSVSQQCASHAPCPTVIVRAAD